MERYDLQSSVNYQFSYTRYIFKVLQKSWKVLIFIAAYSFLAYKLLTFNQYHELFLQIKQTTIIQFWWLLSDKLITISNARSEEHTSELQSQR